MAMLHPGKRFAIRLTAFGVTVFLLCVLGGCAATPKSAPTTFTMFSDTTAVLATDIQKAYLLNKETDTKRKAEYLAQHKALFDLDNPTFGIPTGQSKTSITAEDFLERLWLLQSLQIYAQKLKKIMNTESISTLKTNIATLGSTIDTFKSNALIGSYFASCPVSFTSLSTAVADVVSYGLELKRNKFVQSIITQMQPTIDGICKKLSAEIGTCSPTDNDSASVVALNYHLRCIKDLKDLRKKSDKDVEKVITIIDSRDKCDTVCIALTLLRKTTLDYAKLHSLLGTAFGHHTGELNDMLEIVNTQITLINTIFASSTGSAKDGNTSKAKEK